MPNIAFDADVTQALRELAVAAANLRGAKARFDLLVRLRDVLDDPSPLAGVNRVAFQTHCEEQACC